MTPPGDETQTRPGTAECDVVLSIVADLLDGGRPTAPHVVTKLLRRLDDDSAAVREIAPLLSPAHRSGQRMLPQLLPLSDETVRSFEALDLDPGVRDLLLLASLAADDDAEILQSVTGATIAEIAATAHLRISHGRHRLTDARMRIWLCRAASDLDLVRAHGALEHAYRARGQRRRADWHTARGALERAPGLAPDLTLAAHEWNENGYPERAFAMAVEAADHAAGAQRDEARLVAGAAAVAAGCFDEAAEWLGSLFPHADAEVRGRALAGLLIAETCAQGTVPAIDPAEHRPHEGTEGQWREWARTSALAAVMCAERGDERAMRSWLTEVRHADARAGADGEIREPAVTLCWLLTGNDADRSGTASGPFSAGVVGAIHEAVEGDLDSGLRTLAGTRSAGVSAADPLVAGLENSPLIEACIAVTDVLLRFWQGDVAGARERLHTASVALPISAPFAGLGVALARRLDVTVIGAPGVLPQALVGALPSRARIDGLVDEALVEYLGGARMQAATDIALWHDQGAPEPVLAAPGLDEVGPVIEHDRVEPAEQTLTRALLLRVRRLSSTEWRHEHDAVAEAAKELTSPFGRARVEAMLGATSIIHGDVSAGRRHLHAARRLFESSGAHAWRDAIDRRLARMEAQLVARSAASTAPITVVHDIDPIESSRVAWSAVLRARELEVAMRVAQGRTNGEIAAELEVSVRTIEVHVSKIFAALGVRNRVELSVLAHRAARHV